MKTSVKESASLVSSIIFVLILLGVGIYFYVGERNRQNSADALISKASSKLAAEKIRTPEQITADLEQAKINLAAQTVTLQFYRAQAVFADSPKLAVTSNSTSLDKKIEQKQAEINKILTDWKALIDSSSDTDVKAIAKAKEYAAALESSINQLNSLVDSLTPNNSSLTPEQIAQQQEVVPGTIQDMNNPVSTVDVAQNNNPSNSPSVASPSPSNQNVLTTEQIAEQQRILDNIASEIAALQNELNAALTPTPTATASSGTTPSNTPSNTDSGTEDEYPAYTPPPRVIDTSGKPKLIEWMNTSI